MPPLIKFSLYLWAVAFILSGGCSPSLNTSANRNSSPSLLFPIWFWQTPEISGVEIGVGYANTYYTVSASYQEAFEDAAHRMWKDRQCRITAEQAVSGMGDEVMFMGKKFNIIASDEGWEEYKRSLVVIDSFVHPELTAVLVANRQINVAHNPTLPPKRRTEQMAGLVTSSGTGIAQLYHYWTSSLREAEVNARLDLAFSSWAKVKGLTQQEVKNYGSVIVSETDVILKGIRTVERRINLSPPYVEVKVIADSFRQP